MPRDSRWTVAELGGLIADATDVLLEAEEMIQAHEGAELPEGVEVIQEQAVAMLLYLLTEAGFI